MWFKHPDESSDVQQSQTHLRPHCSSFNVKDPHTHMDVTQSKVDVGAIFGSYLYIQTSLYSSGGEGGGLEGGSLSPGSAFCVIDTYQHTTVHNDEERWHV